jgi:teichuronic acid exporter
MSLGQKALSGFSWTLFSNISLKVVTLAVGIVLARILTPEDFGLVAMLIVFFEVSQSLVDSGFSQALIREERITESDKSTTFFLNVIIAIILYIILWLTAPKIATFYNNQALVELCRFMGLSLIFQSFTLVQRATLTHELKFKKITKINITTSILSGAIGIILALKGFGVWSLAYKYVALSLTLSISYYVLNPWLPRYFINKTSFKKLFGFGSKLLAAGILNKVYQNVYKLIIGKFFTAATLGLYAQSKLYVNQVTQSAVSTLQTVTYPVLSKAKEEPERLREAYRKIIMASSFVIFPLTMGLAVMAKPLILTLVGEKWVEAVPFLQLICLSGALYHLHSINLNILKVMGRSDLFLKLEIIKKINITIAIFIGIQFGIWGLLIGSVISSYVALFINMYYTRKFINYSYKEQFGDLLPIVWMSLPSLLIMYGFVQLTNFSHFIELFIGTGIGVLVYISVTLFGKSAALGYIFNLLSTRYPKLKQVKV